MSPFTSLNNKCMMSQFSTIRLTYYVHVGSKYGDPNIKNLVEKNCNSGEFAVIYETLCMSEGY